MNTNDPDPSRSPAQPPFAGRPQFSDRAQSPGQAPSPRSDRAPDSHRPPLLDEPGHHRHDVHSIRVAVITVSDTRELAEDRSGDEAVRLLRQAGHRVVERTITTDDPERLANCLRELLERDDVDAIVTTGGTGIAPRDRTPEVVAAAMEVEIPGFGESFRAVSAEEIGPRAMLSRAIAGRVGDRLVFTLPGSTGAVRTGLSRCVIPILAHAVGLVRP